MRLLLSGASGFLGSEILRLSSRRHEMISIGRSEPAVRVGPHIFDDLSGTGPISAPPVDTVVHLVQSDKFRELPSALAQVADVNIVSTARLLEWSIRSGTVQRFVLASSGAVYRDARRGVLADTPDIGAYAATRRAAELIASSCRADLEVVILRYFFVYGPGQSSSMFIPRIAASVHNRSPVYLDGDDGVVVNPVHVADAARQTLAALTAEPGIYDVCGPETVSLRDIAEMCGEYLHVEPIFAYTGKRPAEVVGRPADPLGASVVTPKEGLRGVCGELDDANG